MSKGLLFNIFKEAGKALIKEITKTTPKARTTGRTGRSSTGRSTASKKGTSMPKLPTRKKSSRPMDAVEHKEYKFNPHAKLESSVDQGIYRLSYSFKDHKNRKQHFTMSYKLKQMKDMNHRFGFPRAFTGSYRMRKSEIPVWNKMREQALAEGMFVIQKKALRPNPSAIVSYYTEVFCEQIAQQIVAVLENYGTDTERERIEMAMKFIQDIPYAIPYQNDPDYLYGGLVTPPQILYLKFGDCDSKSFLFAGILTYLIPANKIAFLTVPGHLLTAINTPPEKGMAVVKGKGKSWVVAETAGPGRNNLGVPAKYKSGEVKLEPLNYIGRNKPYPYGNSENTKTKKYNIYRAPRTQTDRDLLEALKELAKRRRKIKSLVFSDEGGWMILFGKNDVYHKKMPADLLNAVQILKGKKHEITDIALAPDGEYFITYHNGFGISTSMTEESSNQLLAASNNLTEKQGQPLQDVVFTHHTNKGWIAIYGRNSNGFTCNVNDRTLSKLKPTIQKVYKQGINSISFTSTGGWALIFGKNRMAASLPKKLSNKLVSVVKQLAARKVEINKLYFTPSGDWVIIFDDYRSATSLVEE